MKYTADELDDCARADLLADAAHAERQAEHGPFYPERRVTRESLLAYALECRKKAAEPRPHLVVLAG